MNKKVTILMSPTGENDKKRIMFGLQRLQKALICSGYDVYMQTLPENYAEYRNIEGEKIYIGVAGQDRFISWLEENELLIYHSCRPGYEGMYIVTIPARLTLVAGGDETGALYGCLELADRISEENEIPREIAYYDAPVMKLRGPVVGLQKTKLEPPRLTYEYPITPDRFPWFYDKAMWEEYMEMMLKERCNVLYIWSGHPFSSLVKLPDYPEALEVTEEEYQRNREIFAWLTEECDKRGIWVVLKFYNIHIPYPFAVKHNLELLQSSINPLVADYTYKSIVEFVKSYPHIGLMVCLGEALRGNQNKTRWFVETILPAVKQGVAEAGLKEEPPVILRGHDCDPIDAINQATRIYGNLYTQWKYNGESLTTYFLRGKWKRIHQELSALGTTHIMNVHILADLEPFRFNNPSFIQKCVKAGQSLLGCNGLHLYPLFYWDWPYSPDKTTPRLKQLDRDWIWFAAWFRYAWNPDRDEKDEKLYWIHRIMKHEGCSYDAAKKLLEAQESIGECAPRLLGRIGITEGNRQTLSLGMTMSQLTNVVRYRPNYELWYSVARKGEQPDDYIKAEKNHQPHIGETPYDCAEEVMYFAEKALDKINELFSMPGYHPTEEAERIKTDIEAIYLMSASYCSKIKAAMKIIEYKYSMDEKCRGDLKLLEEAEKPFAESLEYYRKLAELTERTYLYANSMQTPQRKIPFPDGEKYGHWVQCLPEYEKEYGNFVKNLNRMKNGWLPGGKKDESIERLKEASFSIGKGSCETFRVEKGEKLFTDCNFRIQNIAPEIHGLTGIRMGLGEAISEGVHVNFTLDEDSYVLVGYFNSKGVESLQVPDLETNTHADDRGGLAVVFRNALKADGCPPVNIHAFRYEKGTHEMYLGTGGFVIVGVVPVSEKLHARDAGLEGEGLETLDWLYEEN